MTDISTLAADALDRIADPATGKGLIEGGRAAPPRIAEGTASVILDVSGWSGEQRLSIERSIKGALTALPGIADARVAMTAEKKERRLIAVGSGKGGVGKSTVSANIAVALARAGIRTGLIDADIHGPSQPRLMGVEGYRPVAKDKVLEPVMTPHGVGLLSMGQLAKPGQAIAWRGPMTASALGQLVDGDWGDAEVLIVDLPPGTGDIQLSMIQKHRPAGAIIVSTPQDLALIDATRAIDLFTQANVPIVGLIENMAGYACPHCGEISDPFGSGGAEAAAGSMGLPFLGRVPLQMAIRTASDAGEPPAAGDGPEGAMFHLIARQLADWLNLSPVQRF